MRALFGRLHGFSGANTTDSRPSTIKPSQLQAEEEQEYKAPKLTELRGVENGESHDNDWPTGDSHRKEARKGRFSPIREHSHLSSPPPSTISPRLQLHSISRQDVVSSSEKIVELQSEVQALTKSLSEMHHLLLNSQNKNRKCKSELKELHGRIDRMTQHQFIKYKDRLDEKQMLMEKHIEDLKLLYEEKIFNLSDENDMLRECVRNTDALNFKQPCIRADNDDYSADEQYDNTISTDDVASNCKYLNDKTIKTNIDNVNNKVKKSPRSHEKTSSFKETLLKSKRNYRKAIYEKKRNYGKAIYEKWRSEMSASKNIGEDQSNTTYIKSCEVDFAAEVVGLREMLFSLFQLLDSVYKENDALMNTVDILNKSLLNYSLDSSTNVNVGWTEEINRSKDDVGEDFDFDHEITEGLLTVQEYMLAALRIQNNSQNIDNVGTMAFSSNIEKSDGDSVQNLKVSLIELHSILQKTKLSNYKNELKTLQTNAKLQECKYNLERKTEDYKNLQKFVQKFKGHTAAVLRQRHEEQMEVKETSLNLVCNLRDIILSREGDAATQNDNSIAQNTTKYDSPSKITTYIQPVKSSQILDENDEDYSAPYTSAKLKKAGIMPILDG